MLYGITQLNIIPVRLEASHQSEMVTQLLFGEHFKILEKRKFWSKIRIAFDDYEGWVDNKQIEEISEGLYLELNNKPSILAGELIDFISDENQNMSILSLGSSLPFYNNGLLELNSKKYSYDGEVFNAPLPKNTIIETAFRFLNTPFLWGGKTPFGIDSSGLSQTVYKLCGYKLLRDATQQSTQGEALSFIEESEPGDLAFFDNSEGEINHVGIIMKDNYIIHSYGKVRIDMLDHSGIFNLDLQKHTHKLRVIKKII